MRPLWIFAVAWPLLLVGTGAAPGAAATSLTTAEQAMLDEMLGKGVVGAPVAGSPLTPEFAPLREGTWSYRIVHGKDEGQIERDVVTRLEHDPSGASWRYAVGDKKLLFIKQMKDGSLVFVTEENAEEGVITRYEPPEPGRREPQRRARRDLQLSRGL
jgi:hypothetical protein